jgi:endonuclease/exonuclease/phosphatase family metal-dependent hydrolase
VDHVRLATFNILSGRSLHDDVVDMNRYASAVRSLGADVLALQEVDHLQGRSLHADLTAVAAEAMEATEHRFVAALTGTPGSTWMAATGEEQPDEASYGIALLSRYPVSSWEVVRLPPVPVRVPMWWRGSRRPSWVRDEPRVGVAAAVETPDGPVTVVNTHLSFLRWWNPHQLRVLLRSIAHRSERLVLVGDLNMGPQAAHRLTGMGPLASHLTFPAGAPTEQLDHVLTAGGVRATHSEARQLPMSDHRALVVDLEL